MLSLVCFGGSVTRFAIMTFPQKFEDIWSGILEDLPDPIDLAKTQNLNITTRVYGDFIKLSFELFLSSNAVFAQLGPTKRSQLGLKSQPFQTLSVND
jgi:hypothetical protein